MQNVNQFLDDDDLDLIESFAEEVKKEKGISYPVSVP
jgi:hypothetical protein